MTPTQFCPNCASTDIKTYPVDHTEQQGECGGCGAAWRMAWLEDVHNYLAAQEK